MTENHSIDINEFSTGEEVDNPTNETNTIIKAVYKNIKWYTTLFNNVA